MPINIPESRGVIDSRMKADLQAELQDQNPYLRASFLAAMASATAGRNFEFYLQLQNAIDESFAQTASRTSLAMWGALRGITKDPASQSTGTITVTGIAGTVVPLNAILVNNSGNQIETQLAVSILSQTIGLVSLVRTGFTVSAITVDPHEYATGTEVTISGADDAGFNGVFIATVTSATTFTYEVEAQPQSPATGTLLSNALFASIPVNSVNFGLDTNFEGGTPVTFTTTPTGADNTAYTQLNGLSGGANIQSDESFRDDVLFAWQEPNTPFNVSEITQVAKSVPGVTRVFVQEVTPNVGQVTIYFVRDNETNIFPTPQEIQNVKNGLLLIKPANTADEDVFVKSPQPLYVNFEFLAISPDTQSMREAITASIAAFFQDEASLGVDIDEDAYNCAIFSTIDSTTGQRLVSFNLGSPIGDIPVALNELPVMGGVVYA